MPKENVQEGDEFVTRVCWDKDGDVQIAVVSPTPVDVVVGESEVIETDGFYATLGRHSINRLIRILRRARDQAYGQDA